MNRFLLRNFDSHSCFLGNGPSTTRNPVHWHVLLSFQQRHCSLSLSLRLPRYLNQMGLLKSKEFPRISLSLRFSPLLTARLREWREMTSATKPQDSSPTSYVETRTNFGIDHCIFRRQQREQRKCIIKNGNGDESERASDRHLLSKARE